MSKKSSDKNIITLSTFLSLFKETPESVRRYSKLGMPKLRGDKFNLIEVTQWIVEYYRQRIDEEIVNKDIRTLNELADYLKVEPRWINRLVKERGLPREDRGLYNLKKTIPFYVKMQKKEIDDARRGGETESQARTRKFKAEASLKEITLARQRREIINRDDARLVMEEILKAVRDKILGLPNRAAPQLIGMNIPEMKEILDKLVSETLDDSTDLSNINRRLRTILARNNSASIDGSQASA